MTQQLLPGCFAISVFLFSPCETVSFCGGCFIIGLLRRRSRRRFFGDGLFPVRAGWVRKNNRTRGGVSLWLGFNCITASMESGAVRRQAAQGRVMTDKVLWA